MRPHSDSKRSKDQLNSNMEYSKLMLSPKLMSKSNQKFTFKNDQSKNDLSQSSLSSSRIMSFNLKLEQYNRQKKLQQEKLMQEEVNSKKNRKPSINEKSREMASSSQKIIQKQVPSLNLFTRLNFQPNKNLLYNIKPKIGETLSNNGSKIFKMPVKQTLVHSSSTKNITNMIFINQGFNSNNQENNFQQYDENFLDDANKQQEKFDEAEQIQNQIDLINKMRMNNTDSFRQNYQQQTSQDSFKVQRNASTNQLLNNQYSKKFKFDTTTEKNIDFQTFLHAKMAQSTISTPTNIFLNLQQYSKNNQTERTSAEKILIEKYRNKKYDDENYQIDEIQQKNEINIPKQYCLSEVPKLNFIKKNISNHEQKQAELEQKLMNVRLMNQQFEQNHQFVQQSPKNDKSKFNSQFENLKSRLDSKISSTKNILNQ